MTFLMLVLLFLIFGRWEDGWWLLLWWIIWGQYGA